MATILPAKDYSQYYARLAESINNAVGGYFAEKRQEQLLEEDRKFKLQLIQEHLKANKKLSAYENQQRTLQAVEQAKALESLRDTQNQEDSEFVVTSTEARRRFMQDWQAAQARTKQKSSGEKQAPGFTSNTEDPTVMGRNITVLDNIPGRDGLPATLTTNLAEDEAILNKEGYTWYQDSDDKEDPGRYVQKEEAARLEARKLTNAQIKEAKARTREILAKAVATEGKTKDIEDAKKRYDKVAQADAFRDIYNQAPTDDPKKFAAFQAAWDQKNPKTQLSKKDIYYSIAAQEQENNPRKAFERIFISNLAPPKLTEEEKWKREAEAAKAEKARKEGKVYNPDSGEVTQLTPAQEQALVSNALAIRKRMIAQILQSEDTSYIDNINESIIQAMQMLQVGGVYSSKMAEDLSGGSSTTGDKLYAAALALAKNEIIPAKKRDTLDESKVAIIAKTWQERLKEIDPSAMTARKKAIEMEKVRLALINFDIEKAAASPWSLAQMDKAVQVERDFAVANAKIDMMTPDGYKQLAAYTTGTDQNLPSRIDFTREDIQEIDEGAKNFKEALYLFGNEEDAKAVSQAAKEKNWDKIQPLGPVAGQQAVTGANTVFVGKDVFGDTVNPDIAIETQAADRKYLSDIISSYKEEFHKPMPPELLRRELGVMRNKFNIEHDFEYLIKLYEDTLKQSFPSINQGVLSSL